LRGGSGVEDAAIEKPGRSLKTRDALQCLNPEREGMAKMQIVLDADTCREVIELLISRILEHYVFPDVAQRVEEDLQRRLNAGEYDQLTTAELFCLFLTAHLQESSHDKHFFLVYYVKRQPATASGSKRADEYDSGMLQNFGFQRDREANLFPRNRATFRHKEKDYS